MSISKDKVKKIGNLAKIKLTNDEIEIYSTQLTQIVDFMNKLDEVDTSKVESVLNPNLDHHSNRLNDIVEDGNYVEKILKNGSIQLTTDQRKKIINEKKKKIINEISSTATDPKTRLPHPATRIENALNEARFSVDPFLSIEKQVQKAVKVLKPLIPLQFITVKLAFRIPGKDYG